jgi:predicted MFS family arabinose efflux permease
LFWARGAPLPRGATTIREEIREGIAHALRTPRILLVLAVLFVISITVFNFSIYVPLFARNVLQRGPEGFGLLMASVGAGAVGGALTLGVLRAPSLGLLFVTGFLSAGGLLLMSTIRDFTVAAVTLFALGWVSVIVVTGCNVALQLAAPDHLRGRIMSLHTFVYGGVFPFGAFSVGSISEHWGVPTAFRAAGLFALVGLGAVLAWWRLRVPHA